MTIFAKTRQEYLNTLIKPISDVIDKQLNSIQSVKGSDAITAGESRTILGSNPQNSQAEIQNALMNINAKLGQLQNEYTQTVAYASQGQALTQGQQGMANAFGPSLSFMGQQQDQPRQAFSLGGTKRRRRQRNQKRTRRQRRNMRQLVW